MARCRVIVIGVPTVLSPRFGASASICLSLLSVNKVMRLERYRGAACCSCVYDAGSLANKRATALHLP